MRPTSVSAPVAHLVGPGMVRVVNGQLAYAPEGKTDPLRMEPAGLRMLYCYGAVGMTDEAIRVLLGHEVEVAFLTPAGTCCRGRLARGDTSRTSLRLLQHRLLADASRQREWAVQVVAGKIDSQLAVARHHARHGSAAARDVLPSLSELRARCEQGVELEQLRGLEGAASAAWFRVLGTLFRAPWQFTQRTRRPPTDPVNALLSLGYTWVLMRVRSRCEGEGLEVNVGGLHEYRPGRPSLACDVMEPLRVPAVDRWVLRMCNEGRMELTDFMEEAGGVRLQPGKFGRILCEWERHWQESEQEKTLEEWVARLIGWLRSCEGESGSPGGGQEWASGGGTEVL